MKFLENYEKSTSTRTWSNARVVEQAPYNPRGVNRLLKSIHPTMLLAKAELFEIDAELFQLESSLWVEKLWEKHKEHQATDNTNTLYELSCRIAPNVGANLQSHHLSSELKDVSFITPPIEIAYPSKSFMAVQHSLESERRGNLESSSPSLARLPKEATRVLKDWFLTNLSNPYPR